MPILICLLAGLVAGTAGGLFGISGGIVIVPALVLACRFSQHKAQGTSLLALAFPVAALGAYNYWRDGQASLAIAVVLACGFALGHVFGGSTAVRIAPRTLSRAFAVFLLAQAVYLFFKSSLLHVPDLDPSLEFPLWVWPTTLAIGTLAGALGGLFGFGGGLVSVPIMVIAFGLPQHFAQGTALVALTLPVTVFGAYHYHKQGDVSARHAVPIAVGVFGGGLVGSLLALSLEQATMQRVFSVFLTVIALYLLFRDPQTKP